MEQPRFTMTKEYTYDGVAALLLIKTEADLTAAVAGRVARMNEEEAFGGGHIVWGVRWTVIIRPDETSNQIANVVANVKVKSHEDLELLIERIRKVDGVVNPTPLSVDGYFIGLRGHNSLPY